MCFFSLWDGKAEDGSSEIQMLDELSLTSTDPVVGDPKGFRDSCGQSGVGGLSAGR